jgi:(p)ppGpp synthase/HD superfamily hydrolase
VIRTFEAKDGWSALRAQWAQHLREADLAALDEATAYAQRWHGGQTRPAGEP